MEVTISSGHQEERRWLPLAQVVASVQMGHYDELQRLGLLHAWALGRGLGGDHLYRWWAVSQGIIPCKDGSWCPR